MIALRTYFPTLAARVGTTADQLNEWLRALVTAKALKLRPGRGPGSGVELSSDSVAQVLLALMASDIRKEAIVRAKLLAKAKPKGHSPSGLYLHDNLDGWPCPISGAKTLREAIAAGLDGRALHSQEKITLREILISRKSLSAKLFLARGSNESELVSFAAADAIEDPPMPVTAKLGRDVLQAIAHDLRSLRTESIE